jgi:adenosylcobinamide-phosphate synthase
MVLVFALAILLDLMLGEPPLLIHPVVWTGRLAAKVTKPFGSKWHGAFVWCLSVIPMEIGLLLLVRTSYLYLPLGIILSAFILKTTFSIKMLRTLVRKSFPLREESRIPVSQMVRRDVWKIDLGHVASASIESLFESTVDGITGPIFWYILLGLPGALLQRLANTMDSMVGYLTPELREEGYLSAKIDTVLNYIPARLTFLVMLLAGTLLGMKPLNAIRVLKNSKMQSVNAIYPIAAAAGLLGVRLEKIDAYSVGQGELPSSLDIKRALRLFDLTLCIFLVLSISLNYYFYGLSLFGHPYGLVELL